MNKRDEIQRKLSTASTVNKVINWAAFIALFVLDFWIGVCIFVIMNTDNLQEMIEKYQRIFDDKFKQ